MIENLHIITYLKHSDQFPILQTLDYIITHI